MPVLPARSVILRGVVVRGLAAMLREVSANILQRVLAVLETLGASASERHKVGREARRQPVHAAANLPRTGQAHREKITGRAITQLQVMEGLVATGVGARRVGGQFAGQYAATVCVEEIVGAQRAAPTSAGQQEQQW